jgi:hypothetical protein
VTLVTLWQDLDIADGDIQYLDFRRRNSLALNGDAMAQIDLSAKTDDEIETWIANYEAKRATDAPFYKELLEERARRQSSGLKLETSLAHLIFAAHAGHFTTYGDLAKASSVGWNVSPRLAASML